MEKKSRRRKGASQTAKRFPPLQNHCEFKVPRQADVMLRLLCLLQIPPGVNTTMCTVSRNGLWTVDCGLWTVDCGLWDKDCRPVPVDGNSFLLNYSSRLCTSLCSRPLMTVEQSGMDSLIKYNDPQVLSCIQKTILKKRSKWKCLELAEFHGLEFPPIS